MSETAEQKRTRRRWLTLAELVALAGVVIAALSLYTSWSDHRAAQADKQSEKADAARAKGVVLLRGTPTDGGATLKLADAGHPVQSISVAFPSALGVSPQEALVEPRIEADWVARALLDLTHGGDAREGRLPMLVTADWWDADTHRVDRAIYDLVWRTHGRLLRGRVLTLEGVVLRRRGGDQARLDALWAKEKPAG